MKGQKGFSLIELMVVVVIIGILATVGVPQYQKFQMKAKRSEAKSLLSGMYTAQKAFFAEWNQYYSDFDAVGYGLEGNLGYFVGFTSGAGAGPATHPNPIYRANGRIFRTNQYCNRPRPGGGLQCNFTKARSTFIQGGSTVQVGAVPAFRFSASANIDNDPQIDRWVMTQNRELIQQANWDDMAR